MSPDRVLIRERGWSLLIGFLGVSQVGMSVGLGVTGPTVFLAPVFAYTATIPIDVWVITSAVIGVGILVPRTALVGLVVAAVWWALWSALLIFGVVGAGGPFSSVPPYLLVTSIHILGAAVEVIGRRR